MPELAREGTVVNPNPVAQRPFDELFPRPPRYPGYPRRLEAMSAREMGWWGNRFGVDTPYYATPAGWGEWLPVTYGAAGVVDLVILPSPAP